MSGERLQEHWSSGSHLLFQFCFYAIGALFYDLHHLMEAYQEFLKHCIEEEIKHILWYIS